MKEILKQIILDFQETKLPSYTERNIDIPTNTKSITTIIGPRRAGKTYRIYQLIDSLDIDKENIVYINFEDERLETKKKTLTTIITAYTELYPEKNLENTWFFFDEIHIMPSWQTFIRRLHETHTQNIFITGSSSKLLSREVATQLRGRTLSYEVLPLSYKEYLSFKDIPLPPSTKNTSKQNNALQEYIKNGGYPETISYNTVIRQKTLQSYYDAMLYKDIVERHNVKHPTALKQILNKIYSSTSNPFSVHKTYNQLKSQGYKIGKNNVYKYVDHIKEACAAFFLKKWSASQQKRDKSQQKVYVPDTGLVNTVTTKYSQNKGPLYENIVYTELRRRQYNTFYHSQRHECDFILRRDNETKHVVQVCADFTTPKTRQREWQGAIEAAKKHGVEEAIIVGVDQEDVKKEDILIKHVLLREFLLTSL